MKNRYPNLEAEIARSELKHDTIYRALSEKTGKSRETAKKWLTSEKSSMPIGAALFIIEEFFPSCSLDYLFNDKPIFPCASSKSKIQPTVAKTRTVANSETPEPYGRTTSPTPYSKCLKYHGDYVGMRFGNLVVTGYPTKNGVRHAGVYCLCDCGEEVFEPHVNKLFSGVVKCCSKCRKKIKSENAKRRWRENPPERMQSPYREYRDERLFKVWSGMKSRCNCVSAYKDVSVCDEWQDYLVFREWALNAGYDKDAPRGECTIDRINPFGDYEPSNCRWVNGKVQHLNTRKRWETMGKEAVEKMIADIMSESA